MGGEKKVKGKIELHYWLSKSKKRVMNKILSGHIISKILVRQTGTEEII